MKNKISAEVIAHSKSAITGDEAVSFLVTLPRIIWGEVLTHRIFSRSAASSRAIPFKRSLKNVNKDPFIPIEFQKAHSGMQGDSYHKGFKLKMLRTLWVGASKLAIASAWVLHKLSITKQLSNRILEPFSWHTAVITTTSLENFYSLRISKHAEIHIDALARAMYAAEHASTPKLLNPGEWHTPLNLAEGDPVITSVAGCARTSYSMHNSKKRTEAKDEMLHDTLIVDKHLSPTDHQLQCMSKNQVELFSVTYEGKKLKGRCRNYRGFIPYRHSVEKLLRLDTSK